MRQITLLTSLVLLISCSKTTGELPVIRTNPEGRNQEGTKLLGQSNVASGQLTWSTIYYEPGSNRIIKEVDSSMVLDNPKDPGSEYAVTTYEYDNKGKLTQMTADNTPFRFFYNEANGLLIKRTVDQEKAYFTYNYDTKNRITEINCFHADNNQVYLKSVFNYDTNDNIILQIDSIYKDDAGGLVENTIASYVYDDKLHPNSGIAENSFWYPIPLHNTLTSNVNAPGGSMHQWSYNYTYNGSGLPTSLTRMLDGADAFTKKYYYY